MLLIMYDKHTVNVTGQSSFSVAFALMLAHVSSSAVLIFFFFAKWCKVECRYVKGKVLSSQLCCISLCSYDNNNDRYATVTVCYSTFSLQIHFSRLIYSNRNRNVGHSSCHITFQKS